MSFSYALLSGVSAAAITAHVSYSPPEGEQPSSTGLLVPAGRVSSDLFDFPMRVNLADMPSSFWEGVSEDGGNIRVSDAGDTNVPFDLVSFDRAANTGELFVLTDLLAASDNTLKVNTVPGAQLLPLADPLGRNAVWSDYAVMMIASSLEDRSGHLADMVLEGDASNNNFSISAVGPEISVHQGIAYDGTYYYTCDTAAVQKRDASWNVLATLTLATVGIADTNHFGDGCMWNGQLVVPLERYTNSPYDNQHLVFIDPTDMSVIDTVDISAQLHEVSSICYHPVQDCFYVTDYTDPGSSIIHKYATDGTYIGTWSHSPPIAKKQGITYHDGKFWVTCAAKRLYSIDEATGEATVEWQGEVDGFMEGIEAKGDGDLLILFDGTLSAIFTFSPSDTIGLPGWLNVGGAGNGRFNDAPPLTSWTMGVSQVPTNVSGNGTMVSYGVAQSANTTRSSLVLRGGDRYGFWNTNDTWLYDPGPYPNVGERLRFHGVHNTTAYRKIYRNGELAATDNTVTQKPGSSTNLSLFIGAEDLSYAERFIGSLNYVYLRDGELSAPWLNAEYLSWETDTFYSVIPEGGTVQPITSDRFRLYITSTQGGVLYDTVSLADITLYDEAAAPISMTGATVTASADWGGSEVPSSAIDGNPATHWAARRDTTGGVAWLQMQFPSPVTVAGFALTARSTEPNSIPKEFEFQVWDGDAFKAWATSFDESLWAASEVREFMVGHRWWRVRWLESFDHTSSMAELQFRSSAGVAESHAALKHFARSQWDTAQAMAKAFDGDAATHWGQDGDVDTYLGVRFPTRKEVAEVLLQARSAASNGYRGAPNSFVVEYSDDLGATWNEWHSVTDDPDWTASEIRLFSPS